MIEKSPRAMQCSVLNTQPTNLPRHIFDVSYTAGNCAYPLKGAFITCLEFDGGLYAQQISKKAKCTRSTINSDFNMLYLADLKSIAYSLAEKDEPKKRELSFTLKKYNGPHADRLYHVVDLSGIVVRNASVLEVELWEKLNQGVSQ
jgi:hypothetical protein